MIVGELLKKQPFKTRRLQHQRDIRETIKGRANEQISFEEIETNLYQWHRTTVSP